MYRIGCLIIFFSCLAHVILSVHSTDTEPVLTFELRQFYEFMVTFRRSYENAAEQATRFDIFRSNLKIIEKLNNDIYDNATYGITKFADLTADEFKRKMLHFNDTPPGISLKSPKIISGRPKIFPSRIRRAIDLSSGANSFSWTQNPYYPPPYDQGGFDSCGHIGGVSAMSIMYSALKRKKRNLSIQQLIDCDPQCRDAVTYSMLFPAIHATYLAKEKDYPYSGGPRECNMAAAAKGVATISSWSLVEGESEILDKIRYGPLPAHINGDRIQHYTGGILRHCPNTGSNHGATIVGYGIEDGVNYYLVRNTYGKDWGPLQGHLKVERGTCDIEERVYSIQILTRSCSNKCTIS